MSNNVSNVQPNPLPCMISPLLHRRGPVYILSLLVFFPDRPPRSHAGFRAELSCQLCQLTIGAQVCYDLKVVDMQQPCHTETCVAPATSPSSSIPISIFLHTQLSPHRFARKSPLKSSPRNHHRSRPRRSPSCGFCHATVVVAVQVSALLSPHSMGCDSCGLRCCLESSPAARIFILPICRSHWLARNTPCSASLSKSYQMCRRASSFRRGDDHHMVLHRSPESRHFCLGSPFVTASPRWEVPLSHVVMLLRP